MSPPRMPAPLGDDGSASAASVPQPFATARRLIANRDLDGIFGALERRLRAPWVALRRWWHRDHPWMGWIVVATGNSVRLDGCRFDVSHPQITNALRARLWRGRYERSERALIETWLDRAAPVIELGGGIGVVATLVNRRLRNPHRHVVVEANPSLIPVLERQKALNGASFIVEHAAVDYSGGRTTKLVVDEEFISGRVGATAGRAVEVPAVTLARLLRRYPWTGITLVCDIEGIETQLVEHEGELLAYRCTTLIIEVHPEFRSEAECEALFASLRARGFAHVGRVRKVHAFRLNPEP
ncbi:MAG TPA: FkbM family methyltransferase [Vicinamibacterales bacterium]|nr:FkbM family methyltransferase [Vicinamibacterales bacterium]